LASPENSLEQSFKRWCKNAGLYRVRLRLNPGRGWPDDAVLLPGNIVVWIEMKGPEGVLSPQQEYVHAKLNRHGHDVHVCRTLESAVDVVTSYLEKIECN
jgi:hypothetical protein